MMLQTFRARPFGDAPHWLTVATFVVGAAFSTACGEPAAPDVPPVVTIGTTTPGAVASGASIQLTAVLTDRRGKVVPSPTFSWSSANPSIASVSSSGMATGSLAGTTTITATATGAETGATGSYAITVTPGAPAKLIVTTQPSGAASGIRLVTQPVIEVRDLSDNVVTNAAVTVNATLVGAGSLTGTAAVPAAQGIVRFTDLAVAGTVGGRTLQFFVYSLTNVTPANSSVFALVAGPPASLVLVGSSAPVVRSGISASLAVQLRDRDGNNAPVADRRVVAALAGGTGTTRLENSTATTDAQGRATFGTFTATGLAGTRTLTLTADSIAAPLTTSLSLVGGRGTRLALERDVPATAEIAQPLAPAPVVRLLDSLGNTAPDAGLVITASLVAAPSSFLTNNSATTDSAGRATFTSLTVQGTSGARVVQFASQNLGGISSRTMTVLPQDTTPTPAFITTALSAADTTVRSILLGSPTASVLPYLSARNAQNAAMTTAGVRWYVRDATRATIAADGRITGVREGRTFIVAQANRNEAIADSLLLFVPKNATGPIVRTQLPTYRITTDTLSIIVEIESRDGRALTAADLQIAWPGSDSYPYSPFNCTQFTTLTTGVQLQQVDAQQAIRLTWATTTPVTGTVRLARLACRVNQRRVGNQVVIRLNQLLDRDLTDLTASASIFNPVVIIP